MFRYYISRKALEDLDGIWEYTAKEWSEEQASKYYRQLYLSIQSLPERPDFMGKSYDIIRPGLFGYRIGHHIIFYKKHKDGSVWVVRVLHERMDYQRHL